MADLRQRVMSTSAGIKQSVVDKAVDQWQEDSMPMFMHFEQCFNKLVACFMTALNVLSQ